jgi:hypothetical protein
MIQKMPEQREVAAPSCLRPPDGTNVLGPDVIVFGIQKSVKRLASSMRFSVIADDQRRDSSTCRGHQAGLESGERANIRHIGVKR